MYLYLGGETTVCTQDIIGLFDLDTTTISQHTRHYLKRVQQENRVVNTSEELPKSFVVTGPDPERVYICQPTTGTLKKRMDSSV